MIAGVIVKELITHEDNRGFFREVIRTTDPFFADGFGQLSHSVVDVGVLKAWHIHRRQIDWWYVAAGVLHVALHDCRPDSATYKKTVDFEMGEGCQPRCLRIPPGVAHGYRCIKGPAHMIYVMSHVYDSEDEGRIPHDDPALNYDWLKTIPTE